MVWLRSADLKNTLCYFELVLAAERIADPWLGLYSLYGATGPGPCGKFPCLCALGG